MLTLTPLYRAIMSSGDSFDDIERRTGIPAFMVERHLRHAASMPIAMVQVLSEAYGLNPVYAFGWFENGTERMALRRREEEVARKWDRYRRYWLEETRTALRRSFSLDEKLAAVGEYLSGRKNSREIADEMGTNRSKVMGWVWKFSQV